MLIQNELYVSMIRWSVVFAFLRATVLEAISALLIVCRSGCDLILTCCGVCLRVDDSPSQYWVAFDLRAVRVHEFLRDPFSVVGLFVEYACCCVWVYRG